MRKKLSLLGMMTVLMLWGCGQGEKQAEAPVEQAMQQAQTAAGAAVKQAEQAATAAQEKAATVQKQAEAVVASGEKAAAEVKATAEKAVDKALAPETVTLDTKQGAITLPHKKHADAHGCAACHGDQKPGPLALGKEKGHALCQGCHKKMQAGPTSCTKCHQKKG